jgi:hypothetical protein
MKFHGALIVVGIDDLCYAPIVNLVFGVDVGVNLEVVEALVEFALPWNASKLEALG